MALAQKNFERIQMSSSIVERIIALVRPHSLDGSIAYLKTFEDQPSHYLDNREDARRVIADGGGVEFYKWDVSDANGVRKSFRLDSGAADLRILGSSSMFSVELRATGPGPAASVSLIRWVVSPNPGPLSLTIQTDDRFIDDLLEAVTQVIEEHHLPVPRSSVRRSRSSSDTAETRNGSICEPLSRTCTTYGRTRSNLPSVSATTRSLSSTRWPGLAPSR